MTNDSCLLTYLHRKCTFRPGNMTGDSKQAQRDWHVHTTIGMHGMHGAV